MGAVDDVRHVLAGRTDELREHDGAMSLDEALGWLGGLVADLADVLAERLDEIAKKVGIEDA